MNDENEKKKRKQKVLLWLHIDSVSNAFNVCAGKALW